MNIENFEKAVSIRNELQKVNHHLDALKKAYNIATDKIRKDKEELDFTYSSSNLTVNRTDFIFFLKVQIIKTEEKIEELNKDFEKL